MLHQIHLHGVISVSIPSKVYWLSEYLGWMAKNIPVLTDYFESEMLSEIAYPTHKPSYYL